ncbi:FAD/NAD(P)-binding protein [Pigmentibacter sp. JX0631]|uniref:FAD/NAD(P)-binding protein n=1 Tax=Pigmentibacter sp. JX0631 TaxID=2976982 RepID=UPI002469C2C6|nr:FAD/NAD(P)-binding protein [Pigmentibacter sp. JX0631]WGL60884.1 FAD/NAD(P)-binding protein [Pigmentibacter sp. JX0631]
MKKDNYYDIAIIGGGAQATAFISGIYSNFIKKNIEKKIKIIVIDRIENYGCGKVYNQDYPWLLMNTPSTDLSININDSNDFKKWLQANSKTLELSEKNIEYVPRKIFGFYLKEKLEFFIEELKKKNIEIIKKDSLAKKINLDNYENKVTITLSTNEKIYCNFTVLAKGHDDLNDPYKLKGKKNYIHNPFPAIKHLANFPKDCSIGIIGSNLTAIDIALTLEKLGHKNFYMFSRTGKLPEVKGKYLKSEEPKYANLKNIIRYKNENLTLKDLLKFIRKEMYGHKLDWRETLFSKSKANEKDLFIKKIKLAKEAPTPFNVILGMIPEFAKTWRFVKTSEFNKFMNLYYSKIHQKHGAIPLINAEKIETMLLNNILHIRDNIQLIEKKEDHFLIYSNKEAIKCDFVINASGPLRKVCHENQGLLKELCAKNYINEIDIGGIITNPKNGKILSINKLCEQKILAIGHNAEGTHPFINNFAWILETTNEVSLSLLNEVLYGKV